MMRISLTLTAALILAAPVETWECKDRYDFSDSWKNILVVATIDSGRTTGSVTVAGDTQSAQYRVAGFQRRWDFGPMKKNGGFTYSFIIDPNGEGSYYDFSQADTAKPSLFMTCRQRH